MKRWEATFHLTEVNFPGIRLIYLYLLGVRTMRVNALLGLYRGNARPIHTTSALLSLSMIAHVLTNDEYLTRVCIVQNKMYEDSEIVLLYIAPFHDPANAFLHVIELYLDMCWFVDKTLGWGRSFIWGSLHEYLEDFVARSTRGGSQGPSDRLS